MTLDELNILMQDYRIQQITLDFYNSSYNIIPSKQLDNCRYILCTLTENGTPRNVKSNETPRIRLQKPDNTYVYNDCDKIEDGRVLVSLTEQILAVNGKAVADIQLTSSDGNIYSTQNFIININSTPYQKDAIESSNEFDALNNMIKHEEERAQIILELENTVTENEALRNENEEIRNKNENNRLQNEESRKNAEAIRISNEEKRQNNEAIRQNQEADRKINTATAISNAEAATKKANDAADDLQAKLDAHNFDKDIAGGVPSLDSNTKVPIAELYEATTTTKGITQLTDSVTSTSTTTAATPNSVKLVNDSLNSEINRATSTENTLNTNINSEISRAKSAESTLTKNLSDEVTRAKDAENTNANAISTETTRATTKENEIANNLSSEITRAKNAENTLSTNKLDKTTVATSSTLGLVKSGTDITVDTSGNVSVNDNSHKHTVSNISDLTATASELNVLDGITATTTELNYTDGVTSNIQTQLNSKSPLASPALTGTPTAPTASAGTNTTQIATTAFTQTAVSNHNTSTTAHSDIRDLISGLTTRLNALADSDDTTLDQLSEIVAYIKSNRTLIENVTTNKVNVADIVDNLTSTATNKPLSANQGKVLNDLITTLKNTVNTKVDKVSGKGLSTNDLTDSLKGNYDTAYTHSQSTHARTDATKVEASTTNGNIKINGTETTVYTHPSGTNPHGTTKSDVGLGNVGNFKAVSTVANQGLTDTEKANARTNIGAGTSSFSGSYNDLTNKPTIPSVGNGTITIKQAGTSKGTFTMNQSGDTTIELTDNNTTYGVATSSTLGLVKSGTDITVDSSGNVSVNDDSHNHVISNIDGLQSALDGKAASSHTHNYAGSSSAGGSANSALGLSPFTISNIDELDSFLSDNAIMKYAKASNCNIGFVSNDGLVISLPWSSKYGAQIAIDDQSNWMGIRTKNNRTWNSWSKIALVSDIPTNNNQLTNGAGYITSSGSCNYATSAGNADTATSATKATQDGNGNNIVNTYQKKTELATESNNGLMSKLHFKSVNQMPKSFSYDSDYDYDAGCFTSSKGTSGIITEDGTLPVQADTMIKGIQSTIDELNYKGVQKNRERIDELNSNLLNIKKSNGGGTNFFQTSIADTRSLAKDLSATSPIPHTVLVAFQMAGYVLVYIVVFGGKSNFCFYTQVLSMTSDTSHAFTVKYFSFDSTERVLKATVGTEQQYINYRVTYLSGLYNNIEYI